MSRVGPHEFIPLRPPALGDNARCRACYAPKWAHPIKSWVAARPLGDRRPAYADSGVPLTRAVEDESAVELEAVMRRLNPDLYQLAGFNSQEGVALDVAGTPSEDTG